MDRLLKFVACAVGFTALFGGTKALLTEASIRHLCRNHCWFNDLLHASLGETGGHIVLALLWYGLAIFSFYLGWRPFEHDKKRASTSEIES